MLWLVSLALLVGCRASNVSSGQAEPTRSANATATATASASASTSAGVAGAAPSTAPAGALPRLKPISAKPFPEGVSEAAVCEAIDSKEPDLWVRFGHLVPAYVTGAVYVLETGPESKDKLFKYIQSDYVYGYYSQQASCRGSLTLLYIRLMFDKSEYQGKPFGREHLSQAIEQKLGIKTRESFQLANDERRLTRYCRADAALCDALAKLDRGNEGAGLCSGTLAFVGISSHDPEYSSRLKACRAQPLRDIVCPHLGYHLDRNLENDLEMESCRERVKGRLGIQN